LSSLIPDALDFFSNCHKIFYSTSAIWRISVKKQETARNKSFMDVIKALRGIIAEPGYKNGGWLPSGRTMAPKLGASYMTYCKALDRLADEGLARSFPCKGHYVNPEYLRPRKIGIVLGDGGDSPFINWHADIPSAIEYFTDNLFYTQIIQGASFERIHENITVHEIHGLLWFMPPKKAEPVISAIHKSGDIPLLIADGEHWLGGKVDYPAAVWPDSLNYNRKRVSLMAARGHRRVIRLYSPLEFERVMEDFSGGEIDFRPEHRVPVEGRTPGQVLAALKSSGATGIIAEGGDALTDDLFSELSALPASAQPEILHYPHKQLIVLGRRFPHIKLLTLDYEKSGIGKTAAGILVDHIAHGQPLRSAVVEREICGVTERWRQNK
jgi:hypothetical protein